MANVIKHKRGSGSDPSAGNLVIGELAIRTDTGKLFTKMDSGAIAEIAGGGSDIAINTLSSSSGTGGGSATFNGSAYRFTLSAPPSVSAAQLLVSINGVIQKPVTGTGQPSEGFAVDGTDIILGDAPATGSDFFILTFKSLGVSEPADNSVTSAKIVDGAIVNADINASAAIASSKLAKPIDFADNEKARFGTGNDLEIYHDGSNSYVSDQGTGVLNILGSQVFISSANNQENIAKFATNGSVDLYYDNSKKFETKSDGVLVTGELQATTLDINGNGHIDGTLQLTDDLFLGDNDEINVGSSNDLKIYHDGSNSYVKNAGTGNIIFLSDDVQFKSDGGGNTGLTIDTDAGVELYYNNSKKFETTSAGVTINMGTNKNIAFSGSIGEIGSVTGFQTINDAGSANTSFGIRATDIRFATGSAERMRILSNGKILINRTNEDGTGVMHIAVNSGGGISVRTANQSSQTHIDFGNQNGVVGSIKTSGTSTSFNTSSDYRLKENAVAISDGITRLKTLKPYRFNFKADASTTLDGFFAHEVTAVPEAIDGTKDEVDSDNNPIYQGIDQSKLVPLLVAALQEAIGRIEALEAK